METLISKLLVLLPIAGVVVVIILLIRSFILKKEAVKLEEEMQVLESKIDQDLGRVSEKEKSAAQLLKEYRDAKRAWGDFDDDSTDGRGQS